MNAEELINRLKSKKQVIGVIILTKEGELVKSTFDDQLETEKYALAISSMIDTARKSIVQINSNDNLQFIRTKSFQKEILIQIGNIINWFTQQPLIEQEFTLICVRDPSE